MNVEREFVVDKERLWEGAEKMMAFGFPAARYLRENGELDKDRYVAEFLPLTKNDETGEYAIGELEIPAELVEDDFEEENWALRIADFGLGHRREAHPYHLLLTALGIKSEMVDEVEVKKGEVVPWAKQILIAFNERYYQVSHKEGYKNGSAHKTAIFSRSRAHPLVNLALDIWKKLDYQGYHDMVMGNPDENWDSERIDRTLGWLKRVSGKSMHEYIQKQGFTRNIIFWPKVGILDFDEPTVVATTDSVVDPRGWKTDYPTVVEFLLAKERFRDVLGEEMAERVFHLNGFPAQLGGLTRFEYLRERRAQEINNPEGLPVTVVLTASGAATAQKKIFDEIVRSLAQQVAGGEVHIIIQAGYGDLGRQVYDSMLELTAEMEEAYPGFVDNFLLHYSESAQGAIDFGEVLSSGEAPMVFGVKGGEWTRMLLQLGIPQVVPVAIGEQEYWNIITAALQDTCIGIMPKAYEQVSAFIDTFKGFPEELKRAAHLAIDRHRVETFEEGLRLAAWAIAEKRTEAHTNRRAMVDLVGWLMRQVRGGRR